DINMAHIYLNRRIETAIRKASSQFPSLIVTGPRQSGKTTLLVHLFGETHGYVSLDDPDILMLANREPKLFLENYPPPVIIDEIQYAPGLFIYLKMAIDKNRSQKGQFLLTGSQSFPLMASLSESLAGRIAVFTLLTFSIQEQIRNSQELNFANLREIILRGGYPELVVSKELDARLWFSSYLQTYLERDVRNLRQIGDLLDFQRFLELLASINGRILNLSELSRDLGVAVNTIKAWISVLEASHQLILIKPYYKNKGKRIIKSPKIYFLDTGFLCYLSGITHKEQVLKGPLGGSLFETIVVGQIIRHFYNNGEVPRIYWWRTSTGSEVDFIVEKEGKIIPIEVKMTSNVRKELARGLYQFIDLFKDEVEQGYLVTISGDSLKLHEKIKAQPFNEFIDHF
ncbi:MAG: GTP-binding protein, partial [Candidatus Neomarinimicrobiota bacterium]